MKISHSETLNLARSMQDQREPGRCFLENLKDIAKKGKLLSELISEIDVA
jgi:hypothetical protein